MSGDERSETPDENEAVMGPVRAAMDIEPRETEQREGVMTPPQIRAGEGDDGLTDAERTNLAQQYATGPASPGVKPDALVEAMRFSERLREGSRFNFAGPTPIVPTPHDPPSTALPLAVEEDGDPLFRPPGEILSVLGIPITPPPPGYDVLTPEEADLIRKLRQTARREPDWQGGEEGRDAEPRRYGWDEGGDYLDDEDGEDDQETSLVIEERAQRLIAAQQAAEILKGTAGAAMMAPRKHVGAEEIVTLAEWIYSGDLYEEKR